MAHTGQVNLLADFIHLEFRHNQSMDEDSDEETCVGVCPQWGVACWETKTTPFWHRGKYGKTQWRSRFRKLFAFMVFFHGFSASNLHWFTGGQPTKMVDLPRMKTGTTAITHALTHQKNHGSNQPRLSEKREIKPVRTRDLSRQDFGV